MKNLTRKIVVFFTAIFLSISIGSASFADGHGKKFYSVLKVLDQEILFGHL